MSRPAGSHFRLRTDAATGVGFELQCERHGDRFRHQLGCRHGATTVPLVASREDSGEQLWPGSPPFQQVSVEERQEGSVALLVGMAGKSHWSASIEMLHDPVRVRFDVACLARQPPAWLGSSYDLLTPSWETTAEAGLVGTKALLVRVRVLPISEGPPVRLEWADSQVRILPLLAADSPLPRTIRWRYQFELGTERPTGASDGGAHNG